MKASEEDALSSFKWTLVYLTRLLEIGTTDLKLVESAVARGYSLIQAYARTSDRVDELEQALRAAKVPHTGTWRGTVFDACVAGIMRGMGLESRCTCGADERNAAIDTALQGAPRRP